MTWEWVASWGILVFGICQIFWTLQGKVVTICRGRIQELGNQLAEQRSQAYQARDEARNLRDEMARKGIPHGHIR